MNSKQTEGRNQTDANVYIDRAIAMLKDLPEIRESETVAGYNGVVSLLQYAKESHTASLPSKPVGDVECESDHLSINEILNEFNRRGIYTEIWDGDEGAEKAIVDGVCNYIEEEKEKLFDKITEQHIEINQLKSGYAAAPQKGMKELFNKLKREFEFVGDEKISGITALRLIKPIFDESPSPSEAGDEIEIIDGYTQLAIDKRSLPKDGQHVKFMTENEEFHEGYFVGGDDIFHVTDSKFFFKWHVQQWKGI